MKKIVSSKSDDGITKEEEEMKEIKEQHSSSPTKLEKKEGNLKYFGI